LEGILSVLVLDNHRDLSSHSLDEESGEAMSAMSNLHFELCRAMTHTANKLTEAVVDGSGEILEATCNVAIEYLEICADAFKQVREASEGVSVGN
jgi:hypothetical protein